MNTDRPTFSSKLRALYKSGEPHAQTFRYCLIAFDLLTILFVILTSFIERHIWIQWIDLVFGGLILLDFTFRFLISKNRMRMLLRPSSWADLVAIASFLAPLAGEGLGFLRILRTLRLLRTYHLSARLREDFPAFHRNEDVIYAVLNLSVFIFVMTGLIYATQHTTNPEIKHYADALYFTITTLTTTGFGDITLPGLGGRMISVIVMICGVTLFLRLVQVLFRPGKVRVPCKRCGLVIHDSDAVHCKHCGGIMNIETEGQA